ncbi:MAG: leucine-rich repeat protein [Clostridia bacterium]|nr:leucine-rich repeat protein [Clostridia bacterium]
MKKLLFSAFVLVLLFVFIPTLSVSAAETTGSCGDDITWAFEDNTLIIYGTGEMYNYSSTSMPWYSHRNNITKVVIGDGITTIGSDAFYSHTKLEQVQLSTTLRTIGRYAFYNCEKLTNVSFPDSMRTISSYAFSDCDSFTAITIPSCITTIGEDAFKNCINVSQINYEPAEIESYSKAFSNVGSNVDKCTVTFGAHVVYVPANMLYGCTYVTDVEFLAPLVKTIGNYAFYGCERLKSIPMPISVKTIGNYAFYGCKKLTAIDIPASVTSIGSDAFDNCVNVEQINYNPLEIQSIDGRFTNVGSNTDGVSVYFGSDVVIVPNYIFNGCTNIVKVQFYGMDVETIGNSAFYGCTKLGNFTLPANVKTIGSDAFSGCKKLTVIDIPKKVTSIGNNAFDNCVNVEQINYNPPEIQSIDGRFSNVGSNTDGVSVYFGSDVVTVPKYIFSGCTNIVKVQFYGMKVETIGESAFNGCTKLGNISFPANVKTIGQYAFENCKNFTKIVIPSSVKSIGYRAFSGCSGVTEIDYNPADIASLDNVFSGVGSDTDGVTVGIGSTVVTVPKYIFNGCTNIVKVQFYGINAETIGESAFDGCTKLGNISFPANVKTIGQYAFENCKNFTKIVIPSSVKSIGYRAFSGCSEVTEIDYSPADITSLDNVFSGVGSDTDGVTVTIGANVEIIPKSMFSSNKNIASVTINGEKIKTIGSYAFDGCSNLATITLPKSLTTVSSYAFDGCSNLSSAIYYGNSLEWKNVTVGYKNDALLNALDIQGPEPEYTVGDINGNGKIDARDYLLLKRAYFGTYTLTCAPEAADINGNGKIDARDYLLLKRAYFGTYTIQ